MKLPKIVIDSNEASRGKSWKFNKACRVQSLLKWGCDYSLWGYTGIIGIERKSWPDYVRCLGKGWDGFLKQIKKLSKNEHRCIIVEGNINDYIHPRFTDVRTPSIIHKTSIVVAKNIPVIFAGNRSNANAMAYIFLQEAMQCQMRKQLIEE